MKAIGYILVGVGAAAAGFAAGYFFKAKKDEEYIHEQIVQARASIENAAKHIVNQFDEQGGRILEKKVSNTPYHDLDTFAEDIRQAANIIPDPLETSHPHFEGQFTDKEDMHAYLNRIHGSGYDDPGSYNPDRDNGNDPEYRNGMGETKEQEMERRLNAKPYQMDNQNFGQFPDHELVGFTLYSDGILANDGNERIYDSRDTTGVTIADLMDMMNAIPEDEEKVLFFRNEKLKLDIEIISSDEIYQDTVDD